MAGFFGAEGSETGVAVDDHSGEAVGEGFAGEGDELGVSLGNQASVLAFDNERDQL